jgi:putative FmdB family regulatory protein
MPVYSYKCPDCGYSVDVRTELDKADLPKHCPKCKIAMRKLLGLGGVSFKGNGFYSTDK